MILRSMGHYYQHMSLKLAPSIASSGCRYPNSYGIYNRPSWFTVFCIGDEDGISDCSLSSPVGYTECSYLGTPSAEVSCGQPSQEEVGGLSGAAISGIVIGCLVALGVIVYLIHLRGRLEKKKKAAAAAAAQRQTQTTSRQEQTIVLEARTRPTPAQQPPVSHF